MIDARTVGEDRVLLTTAPQSSGVAYTLVVRAVRDLSGQEIVEGKGDRSSFRFAPVVSFATQIQPIFDTTCSFIGCHAASEQSPLVEGLVLAAGLSLENLLEVPSRESASLNRVKTGAPDESYITLKLEGSEGILGARMPQGDPFLRPPKSVDFDSGSHSWPISTSESSSIASFFCGQKRKALTGGRVLLYAIKLGRMPVAGCGSQPPDGVEPVCLRSKF